MKWTGQDMKGSCRGLTETSRDWSSGAEEKHGSPCEEKQCPGRDQVTSSVTAALTCPVCCMGDERLVLANRREKPHRGTFKVKQPELMETKVRSHSLCEREC
jgi:hypothetical protein